MWNIVYAPFSAGAVIQPAPAALATQGQQVSAILGQAIAPSTASLSANGASSPLGMNVIPPSGSLLLVGGSASSGAQTMQILLPQTWPAASVNQAMGDLTIALAGPSADVAGPFNYVVSGLPPGVSLDSKGSTTGVPGTFYGTPTAGGTYTISVTVINTSTGNFGQGTFTWVVS